jgi:outer membrane protein assembly factor BamB
MRSVLTCSILCLSITVFGQWRGGSARDGHFEGDNLLKEWPESGPAVLFETDSLGLGWGSAIEADNQIYIVGKINDNDYLSALDADGRLVWQSEIGPSWNRSFPDARSTPTVEANRVYVTSGLGKVACFQAADGKLIWSMDTDSIFDGEIHTFGASETTLIVDDMVFATPSGNSTTIVALNKMTGELIWQSENVGGSRSYASPILYEHEGLRQIIGQTSLNLYGVDPKDGSIQWTFPYFEFTDKIEKQRRNSLNLTNCPIYKGYELFFSHGYDYPAVMLTLSTDGQSVTPKWISRTLDNHHHGLVEHDGAIYGSNWLSNKDGKWVSLNWDTGETTYVHHWYGKGVIIEADGLFYIMDEKKGNVGLLEPDKDAFKLISTFHFEGGEGMYWAHPTIFNGTLYIRRGGLLRAFNISNDN